MNIPIKQEQELIVLDEIHRRKTNIRQRDIAKIIGVSLGMTNAILKRLINKGWLQIKKINNRNVNYIVSPKGIEELTRRSFRFFKSMIKYPTEEPSEGPWAPNSGPKNLHNFAKSQSSLLHFKPLES